MSKIKFKYEDIKKGDYTQVREVIEKVKNGKLDAQNILYAIDAAAANPEFLERFKTGFSKEWGSTVGFTALTEDQMKIQYDVTQGSVTPTIATTILPSMEALVRSSELLNRISIIPVDGNSFYQMFDFDAEQNAAILTEVAEGTDVDEVLRNGDRLIANQKVQASMKMSEWVLSSLSPETLGKYMARLTKRVRNQLCIAVLANGSGASNGTAKGDNIRGILNNYGVNATGDTAGTIGAIAFATKAATDTAITALGGVASTDSYDLLVKAKAFLLPTNITDIEEDDYIFIGNRISWAKVSTVVDGNGRYKASSAISPLTGKMEKKIDDADFLVVPSVQCPTDRVYIVPPKGYTLVVKGDIINLNDGGMVQMKEGLVQFVSRSWVNGSMEYGQKFRPATAVTVGTTVPDNGEQNAYRVITL